MKPWFVYILLCADSTLYTGITTDVMTRIKTHNTGTTGAKYTRARRPVRLLYTAEFPNKSEASKEESRIKKLSRIQKQALYKI